MLPSRSTKYEQLLQLGLEYQDYITEQLYLHGMPIFNNYQSRSASHRAENSAGIEIKLDQRFRQTGRYYIETHERTRDSIPYSYSGILRRDNCWLWCIGDREGWVFITKKDLVMLYDNVVRDPEYYESCHGIRLVTTATSKGMVIPLQYAQQYLVCRTFFPLKPPSY